MCSCLRHRSCWTSSAAAAAASSPEQHLQQMQQQQQQHLQDMGPGCSPGGGMLPRRSRRNITTKCHVLHMSWGWMQCPLSS
jgi:hypothetical protein